MDLSSDQLKNLGGLSPEGRELKTMVFIDLVGSTQLKEELGDIDALKLIHRHHQRMRELLATHPGAREISASAGSFLFVFNAPSDAVRFALQLRARLRKLGRTVHQPLRDRIGIHAGEVLRYTEADSDKVAEINGIQVDTCARVMALAGPDHILLTRFAFDNARQMLKGVSLEGVGPLEWRVHGFYELQGLREPVEICEVTEAGTTLPQAPTDSEMARRIGDEPAGLDALLVEQAAELAFLRRLKSATLTDRRQGLVGAALASGLGILLLFLGWLDNLSFDLSYLSRRSATAEAYTNAVEFVVMDDASLKNLDQPSLRAWDRRLHARLIDWLRAAQARAVVFDIVFQTNRPSEDPDFIAAIRRLGKVAVAVAQHRILESGVPVIQPIPPFDELRTNAWCGLIESARVADLTVRQPRFGRPSTLNITPWNSLAEELVYRLEGVPPTRPSSAWLNYYCPPSRVPSRSYYQVLSNYVEPSLFSNKVVFVGSQVQTLNPDEAGSDRFRTPYSRWGYAPALGVIVNATSYLNLARGDWLRRPSPGLELLGILAVGLAGGYLLVFLSPIKAAGAGILLAMGLAGASVGPIWLTRTWFPWLIPCLVQIPIATLWSILANTRRITIDERRMHQALALRRSKPAPSAAGFPPSPSLHQDGATVVLKTRFEVPDHQLYRLIGEGAYGQVWLARNAIGTFHAVKIVQRSSFTEERPYEREFHGLQRFTPLSRQHPGLVQILHVGRNDTAGFMYYIMEIGDDEQHGQQIDPDHYVPRNLSRDLARRGYLSVAETVNLAIPLAEALGFLHKNGLIHRDIKPSNIIFVKDHPKLADIGLVTEMAGGGREITFVGTVGYSAPEGPGSAAGDIFSLGKLLYVACTGCPVTQFPDLPSSHSQRPDAEDLLELNRMILKACEPVVQRRYASTQSLVADLRRLQAALLPTTTDTLPGGGS